MNAEERGYSNIDEYIALYEGDVKERMEVLRAVIHECAPEATEKISWDMPTFYQNGNLVHFAAATRHIGLYPGASGVENFVEKLDAMGLKHSKGAIQMPNSKPLPLDLVREIVTFRVAENVAEAEAKKGKK